MPKHGQPRDGERWQAEPPGDAVHGPRYGHDPLYEGDQRHDWDPRHDQGPRHDRGPGHAHDPRWAAPRGPGRPDPLAHPVAITQRAIIGDQIRMPVAACDMAPCRSWFSDPLALGEADVRALAIRAGWRLDSLGRLACPACQRGAPLM